MGEAILIKAIDGGSFNGGGSYPGTATEGIYTTNGFYTCTKSGNYRITCVGGGGGGGIGYTMVSNNLYVASSGGSGYKNSIECFLYSNTNYSIIIGSGGRAGFSNAYREFEPGAGGITSFSDIVYASGGTGGHSTFAYKDNKNGNSWVSINIQWVENAGVGYNNGINGISGSNPSNVNTQIYYDNAILPGGWLYYKDSLVINTSISGHDRLYYGDGGYALLSNSGYSSAGAGNSGAILIEYMG